MKIYFDDLFSQFNFEPKDKNIFLVQSPDMSMNAKKRLCDFLFEKYEIENVFLKNTASLSSFFHSKDNSIVIDVGGFTTNINVL